jgi:RHS repeat-associated protein
VTAGYNGAGSILRRFVWGPGADKPILQDGGGAMNCSGTKFLHTNDHSSVVEMADCSINWGPYQYTGQWFNADLAMLYYKARFYSPTLGRFMQTDPIGSASDINAYAHMAGDSINANDPSGLMDADVGGQASIDHSYGYGYCPGFPFPKSTPTNVCFES